MVRFIRKQYLHNIYPSSAPFFTRLDAFESPNSGLSNESKRVKNGAELTELCSQEVPPPGAISSRLPNMGSAGTGRGAGSAGTSGIGGRGAGGAGSSGIAEGGAGKQYSGGRKIRDM